MQLKETHNFVKDLVKILSEKVEAQAKMTFPEANEEYTKGQLYEAQYILGVIEKIIYENKSYNY